jgi:two-component system, LytTR family, response regulator
MSRKIQNHQNALYIQASESYSLLKLADGKTHVKTRPMKFFINILETYGWCQIHKSYMVNPQFVESITADCNGICLQNGQILPISRRNKKAVLKWRINSKSN